MTSKECICQNPSAPANTFTSTLLGVDESHGRFGEVSLQRCLNCQRLWLQYFVEYEGSSQSGRWYRGEITPENAVTILKSLPEVVYGGSWFRDTNKPDMFPGGKGAIAINVDQ